MTNELQILIQAIHDAPHQLMLVIAGAGHSALSRLLDVAGASRTVLEALVPYSQASFDDFLGHQPDQYVASQTARLLAGRAYTRARQLGPADKPLLGIACTAAITTARPKRGDHRTHIVCWQPAGLVQYDLLLAKDARTRLEEETLISTLILNGIAEVCDVHRRLPLTFLPGDDLALQHYSYRDPAQALITGTRHSFGIEADGLPSPIVSLKSFVPHPQAQGPEGSPDKTFQEIYTTPPPVILSGAFNPLHEGHLGMAQAAETLLKQPVVFELAAVNVDKPPLAVEEILARTSQFAGRYSVLVSDAPTYIGKARLYPGATFVVGYDTAVRIFAPRYYGDSVDQMMAALAEIEALGCHFLVAGRVDEQGLFRSLADLAMPPRFATLFSPIPETLFRRDISSTTLRATGQRGDR